MNRMAGHVKILGILHIVYGVIGVLIGLVILAVFGGTLGIISNEVPSDELRTVVPIVGGIGGFIFLIIMALSIPGIIAGIGLLSFRPWARIVTLVISFLDMLNFPIGTALGVYGIWVLLSKDGTALFEGPYPASNPPYGATRG